MKKKLMHLGLASIISTTIVSKNAFAASEIILAKHDADLIAHNIDPIRYTEESYNLLIKLIESDFKNLENTYIAQDGEISNKKEIVLKQIQDFIQKSKNMNSHQKEINYSKLLAVDYSIAGMLHEKKSQNFWTTLKRLFNNILIAKTILPFADVTERDQKLNDTSEESINLTDANGTIFTSPEQLSGMSINQIAALDVLEDDSMWYSEKKIKEIKDKNISMWQYLENLVTKEIQDEIKSPSYNIDQARRVLFFDEIKTTATSPKVNTKDAFGVKWKVKWGEEIQTEAISNRLYVQLGGKFTDLVYVNTKGDKDLILVLDEKTNTLEKFKDLLLNSVYKFNVSPYILKTGVITEDNAAKILTTVKQNDLNKYIGRTFVTFKESSVSLEALGFKKNQNVEIGASDLNSKVAQMSRVKRALAVFTYWIRNKDAKEDNSKTFLTSDDNVVEYYHDLGASLGGLIKSGDVNKLKSEFIFKKDADRIYFKMRTLYRPKAFAEATMADQLWMARKILNLSSADLQEAMASTSWPQFQQKLFLTKLINRRNNIQEIYQIGKKMETPISFEKNKKITFGFNLETIENRIDVIRSFNLAMAFDNDEQKALDVMNGLIKQSRLQNRSMTDPVYTTDSSGAKLLDCKQSIIVNMIETYVHPSGLSSRVQRGSDDEDRPLCKMVPHIK